MKNGCVILMDKPYIIAIFMAFVMIVSMFSVIGFVDNAKAHVLEEQGNPLQLYSYFYGTDLADGQIDGNIENNAAFWARGYARQATFIRNEDGTTTIPVSLFFVNSNNYLYIALSWDAGNAGGGNGVWIFFDEGNKAGVSNDGTHDDALTNPSGERNEDALFENKNDVNNDLNWNNAAQAWQNDATGTNKVMTVNSFGSPATYFNAEFKIPLTRENDDSDDSNLDITGVSEIGIYIIIYLTGGGPPPEGHYYWDATNVQSGNKNSAGDYEPLVADSVNNQWGDLKLGVAREDITLYSASNINGDPTVDGNINDDLAWTNAYRRQMVFTNFLGATMDVEFFSVQNQVSNNLWCGFWVEDSDFNGADEFHIFQEREVANNPALARNYLLDDGIENQISTDVAGSWEDRYYEWPGGGNPGVWTIDIADQQGLVAVQYFSSPRPHYEFEFELPYQAGVEDLNVVDNGLFGFLMKFVDNDMPAGEQEFFWELTANDELIQIEEGYEVNIAVGWADFQMGGPVVYPVTPDDGGVVFGRDYVFRIYAHDEEIAPPFGIVSAAFKTENMASFKTLFWDSDTEFWYTFWDTTGEPNGATTVTISVTDNDGITVYLMIDIIVANPGPAGDPPLLVQITAPPAPGPLSGPVNFDATAVFADYIEFHLDGMLFAVDNTVPFGASLDTTLFNDGGHIISIKAVNTAGETWDSEVYEFDNWNLNSLMITQPVSGSMVSGSIPVTGDYEADGSGQLSELFVDDEFWDQSTTPVDLGGGDMAFEFTLDTTLLSEGNHEVQIFVYDPDGNVLSDKVIIIVDNILPGIPTIASLIDGQFIDGTFTFKVQCDRTDLASVELTIPTVITNMPIGYNSASGYYEYSLDTTALADGDYSVSAVSWDTSGNSVSSTTVNFKVDNNAPTLSVSSPLDNAIVSGDVTFNYTATDTYLSDVWYKIDGNSWVDIMTPWATTTFKEGEHMASIKAMDESGHSTMITLDLVVDNNAPDIAILNPVDNQFLHDDFTFRIRAEDEVGLSDVRITIENTDSSTTVVDDISIILNEVSGHYEYTMDTMTLIDGNYSITAMAYDMSGKNSGDVSVNFMVDNHAPMLMLTAPLNGDLLTGSVPIDVDYSDIFLVDMVYRIDGGAWVDLGVAWDTSLVNDGGHTIDIKLTDEAGHITMQTVSVSTDNNAPELYPVYWPSENIAKSFKIQMYARDAVELVEVTYQIDNLTPVKMFENIATGFYEAEIAVDSFSDGDHTLRIMATDSVELSTHISTTITVDNSGPVITIAEPAKGKTVKGDVEFIVELTDATGIKTVQISIDKGEWKDMKLEDGKYVYNWNSRNFYNGKYDVDVRAVDTLGNEAQASSDIKVDNFPMLAFLIFIIVLVILLVLMVVSWGRKPKPKRSDVSESIETEETESEEVAGGESMEKGTEIVTTFECPECGTTLDSSDTVCTTCGVELEGEEKGGGEVTPGIPEQSEGL